MATEVVAIQLELMGADGVKKDLKDLQSMIQGFRGNQGRLDIQSNLKQAEADIIAYRGELELLKRNIREVKAVMTANAGDTESEAYQEAAKSLEKYNKDLVACKDNLWNAQQRQRELNKAMKDAGSVQSFGQAFSQASLHIARFGSALQSLGNTLTKISRPFQRLFRGTIFAAGYKLLNLFTSSLTESTKRFDTMTTYIPVMRSLGAGLSDDYTEASEQLRVAGDLMYESILGLPTGFDEIINRWKLLTVATKDYNLAAALAIAENNAILASGAEENVANISRRMLQTYLTTGELNARQWNSMLKGMPVAWNIMEKHLQESGRISGSLMENMQDGALSAEEFAQALIEAGQSAELQSILNQMKHTFASATANIGNFTRRMGEAVIRTFNDILLEAYGKDLIDMLNDVSATIERVTPVVQEWLLNHKDLFINFIDAIKSLDWKGFFTGLADGLALTLEQATKLIELLSKNGGMYNIGKFFARAGMWGKVFTALGGIIKGLRHPLAALFTLGRFGVGGLMGYGLFGNIGVMLFGKGNKGLLTMGRAVTEAPTAVNSLRRVVDSLAGIATVAGGALMIGGTVTLIVKMVKTVIQDLKEIAEITSTFTEDDWNSLKKIGIIVGVIEAIGAGLGAWAGFAWDMSFGAMAESKVLAGIGMIGLILTEVLAFAALDTWLIKKTAENIKGAMDTTLEALTVLNDIKDVSVDFKSVTKVLDDFSQMLNLFMPQGNGSSGLGSISESMATQMANKAKAMADVIRAIKESGKALAEYSEIPELSFAQTKFTRIIDDISKIYMAMVGSKMGEKDATSQAENFSAVVDSIIGMFSSLNESVDMFNELAGKSLDIENMLGEDGLISQFARFKDEIFTRFASSGTIGNGFATKKSPDLQAKQMEEFGIVFESILSIVHSMSEIISELKAMMDLGTLNQIELYIMRFGKILEKISEVYMTWEQGFDGVGVFDGAKSVSEDLGYFYDIIGSVGKIVTSMKELSDLIDEIGENDFATLGDAIVPFIDSMNGIGKALDALNTADVGTKLDLMSAAIGKVKSLMQEVSGMAGDESAFTDASTTMGAFVEALKLMSEQIAEIAGTWNEAFAEGLDMEGLLETIEAGIEAIITMLNNKNGKFAQAGVNNGMAYVNGLKSQLNSITVYPTIDVQVGLGSISGLGSVITGVRRRIQQELSGVYSGYHYHRGGMVRPLYRASGGGIFTPRGTDIVPAMLTPGEFVQNRKAVSTFGIDFMRRVNALDVRGAMESLQARMASRLSSSRVSNVSNVVNNNNNQKFTQNVYTNNPNFAFKRSSRYVGAI